jgi:hypothetical protein
MEQEDIIRKIQKLLNLGQSSNEAEANLAMARAQSLLAKHNLEYAMVKDAVVPGGLAEPAPEKREKVTFKRTAQYLWQRELWQAIAEANFCWYWTTHVREVLRHGRESKIRVKRHMVLGKESNVLAVRMMGEYLTDTIESLLPYEKEQVFSRTAHSWRRGFADRLVERINADAEKRKRSKRGQGDGKSLVLRDVYKKEYEANYDALHGEGAYSRKLIADAKWEAEEKEREKVAAEEEAKAEREWLEYLRTESPEARVLREKQEARERLKEQRRRERRWNSRSWGRERAQAADNTDWDAYSAGKKAGDRVSLGAQVKQRERKQLT